VLKRTVAQGGGTFKQRKRVAFSLIFFFKREIKQNPPFLLHLLFGVGSADDSTKAKGGTP
jgi:hypothetical protein